MSKLKYYDGTSWNTVNGQVIGDTLPIGSIIPFGSTSVPTGWLICDGTAVSRTTYAELYSVIGTSYGTGDGSTTFNLPNLKGRVPVGQDSTQTEFDIIGETGGSKYLQEHYHEYKYGQTAGGDGSGLAFSSTIGTQPNKAAITNVKGVLTGNAGNLQPYQVVCYIIKAKQSVGLVANVSNVYSERNTDTYSCSYINELINMLYPIGSIIIKADNNDYSNWLGFTWERTLVGRVAVGIDSTQTEFDTIGETGGNKTISYTPAGIVQNHTLTINEIPSHNHGMGSRKIYVKKGSDDYWDVPFSSQDLSYTFYSQYTGEGQGHNHNFSGTNATLNNIQPYQVVAYWKRVS